LIRSRFKELASKESTNELDTLNIGFKQIFSVENVYHYM